MAQWLGVLVVLPEVQNLSEVADTCLLQFLRVQYPLLASEGTPYV